MLFLLKNIYIMNKKILLLLFLCLFINFAFAENNKNFHFKEFHTENKMGISTFTFYSQINFNCDITFLALPAEYTENEYSTYDIRVNNKIVKYDLSFNKYGWQRVYTEGNIISLQKGVNIIEFISHNRDLPQIKQIEIFDDKKNYKVLDNNYFTNICYNNMLPNYSNIASNSLEKPVYRLGVEKNKIFSSTFLLPLYYEKGEKASYYGPTSFDPIFGIYESDIEYNVYFFYENPEIFSISDKSNNKYVYRTIDSLPETGIYYLLVEAQNTWERGYVTLHVNNNMLYKYNPISASECYVLKEFHNGNIYVDDKNSPYNIFTVNSRSTNSEKISNPCIWLKKEVDGKYIVVAYNDDNNINSDFNWGKNSRIRTNLDDATNYKVSITSSDPISYNDTCDIYHSFWSTPTLLINNLDSFINLKKEDLIESGESTDLYNCISWSAGVNYIWLNPEEKGLNWFDKLYNNETVYDGVTTFKRPDSFPKYTREGANEENSVLYLWGDIENGDTIIKHASIKNNIDGNPHGYDWESKFGSYARAFHPRLSLQNSPYGNIVACYRRTDDNECYFNPQIELANAIVNNELITESIEFTEAEKYQIKEKINLIDKEKLSEIETYYEKWFDFIKKRKYESIIWNYQKCKEFHNLLNLIKNTKNAEFIAYEKFIDGDVNIIALIKELAYSNTKTKEIWDSITKKDIKDNVIRNHISNVTLYIKSILQNNIPYEYVATKISNNDNFNVYATHSSLKIDMQLNTSAKCKLQIININTNNIETLMPERTLDKGIYSFEYNVSPGLYIINFIKNGNINAKKIIIK